MFKSGTTTVTNTTPTAIFTPSDVESTVFLQNTGSVSVYLGGSTVTADTSATGGFKLASNGTLDVGTSGGDRTPLYGVVVAGSGATATASVSGNAVQSVSVGAGGSNYSSAPTVVFTPTNGDTITIPAVATATVSGGAVTAVTVSTHGAGYAHAPTVSFIATDSTTVAYLLPYFPN